MWDIYRKYLSEYIKMNNSQIELVWTWKLVGIINEGSRIWAVQINRIIDNTTSLSVSIVFTLYMIWRINIIYCIVFLLLWCTFLFIVRYIDMKQEVFRDRRYEYRNSRLRKIVKIIMCKMEILQSWNIWKEASGLDRICRKISNVSIEMSTYRLLVKRVAPFSVTIFLCFIFFILWNQVLLWDISLSLLVWLSWALILMQRSITDIVNFYVEFTKEFISIEKLWRFLDDFSQIQGYEEWSDFIHKNGKIELKNMSYGYDENKSVFTNFDLEVPGNRVTALVGPSGGGKSTLVKLISWYIRQDSWDILIDNQNLRDVSLKSYYKDVWYLTQEPSVFDGTVRENLLYAVSETLWDSEIEDVIKQAHCEFIYDLPNGFDTEIWERGVKLSWGQKQRLTIAKIFLKNPKIIILDEPTSALDSLSEKKITEAMHNLFKNRTVLVIAHRLQTVKHADDIIVIESGKIRERGMHTELVKNKWFYKEMLDLQSGF